MTIRLPVNASYVNFRDGQAVTQKDLVDEQLHFLQVDSAIVNNFFGSGILLEAPTRTVVFNSDELTSTQQLYVSSNDFDGRGIEPHNQPTDKILGNQLEIELINSDVSLKRSVKVCIIGSDFQNNLQYETFQFNNNEIQVGKKHFKTIISFLFVDFKGNKNCSMNLGGSLLIREAVSMQISRDEMTVSQNLEPNLFFRDFKPYNQPNGVEASVVLYSTLQEALFSSGYSVDALNINIGHIDQKTIGINDISTRLGQKFKAKVNNIQKVRLLLGVNKDETQLDGSKVFDWSGDLIVSIHALQTSVSCSTDSIPDNAIDYQPKPTPIAQIVVTQNILKDNGIYLTNIPQPIDFVFSNTRVGNSINNSGIVPNNYYTITIQRAGDTTSGIIFSQTGRNYTQNSTYTEYNGVNWTDDQTQDLWFEILSDSLKVASGIGYDAGNGFSIEKTELDDNGDVVDYCKNGIELSNGGVVNYTVVQAITDLNTQVQSDMTGDYVYSKKQSIAEISTLTSSQIASLKSVSEPVIIGCSYDLNTKNTIVLNKSQQYIGLGNGNIFSIIKPDSDLLAYNLVGSKFNPNINNPLSKQYIIYKATLCTNGYGDLNGDGYVGWDDITRAIELLGEDITTLPTQDKIKNGTISCLELLRADVDGDGKILANDINYIQTLYNKNITTTLPFGESFQVLNLYVENLIGRNDGYFSSYDGYARLWENPYPRNAQYNVDSALLAGSYNLPFYGYPVPVDIEGDELALQTTPFVSVNFSITITPNWFKELVKVNITSRFLPCTFSSLLKTNVYENIEPKKTFCNVMGKTNSCDGGRNDFFIPDNLIIGNGQLLTLDGKFYPIDLEIGTITLTLPAVPIADKSLDVFRLFVAETSSHTGFTSVGYAAMRFADNSFVQLDALSKHQVKFNISIESLSQNIDGYDDSIIDGYGVVGDPLLGTFIDHATGILTIRGSNLNSGTALTNSCKLNISIYMKKAGWSNNHLTVGDAEVQALLQL